MRSFLSTEIDVTSPSTQLLGICGQFRSTSNLGALGGDCASSPTDPTAIRIKAADAANRKYFTVLLSPTALLARARKHLHSASFASTETQNSQAKYLALPVLLRVGRYPTCKRFGTQWTLSL